MKTRIDALLFRLCLLLSAFAFADRYVRHELRRLIGERI
jgi:hypothetical protein